MKIGAIGAEEEPPRCGCCKLAIMVYVLGAILDPADTVIVAVVGIIYAAIGSAALFQYFTSLIQITRPTAPRSMRSPVFKLWRRCPAKVLPRAQQSQV